MSATHVKKLHSNRPTSLTASSPFFSPSTTQDSTWRLQIESLHEYIHSERRRRKKEASVNLLFVAEKKPGVRNYAYIHVGLDPHSKTEYISFSPPCFSWPDWPAIASLTSSPPLLIIWFIIESSFSPIGRRHLQLPLRFLSSHRFLKSHVYIYSTERKKTIKEFR